MADEDENNALVYTMPMSYVNLILEECTEQISILTSLIESYIALENKEYFWCSDYHFMFLCETLFANFKLKELFTKELNDSVFMKGKSGKKELLILKDTIQMVEALLLARYQTVSELKRLSISTALN